MKRIGPQSLLFGLFAGATAFFVSASMPCTVQADSFADGSRVMSLLRVDGVRSMDAPSPATTFLSGTVLLERKNGRQSIKVAIENLPPPGSGYGVFVSSDPLASNNVSFVNILANPGADGRWTLDLNSKNGAPPQLGVADVNQLVGQFLFIADPSTNIVLRTKIQPLVPSLTAASFRRKVTMYQPFAPPSPRGKGTIRLTYNARTGATFFEVRMKKLAENNTYCSFYTYVPVDFEDEGCDGSGGIKLEKGNGFVRRDTSKGDDLPVGYLNEFYTVDDLVGLNVEVVDVFGAVHLIGPIP